MSEPCKLPDGRRLFRLDYFVRLTDDHPMRSVAETGKLIIWCFDDGIEHAAARALHLFNVLPFQAISDEIEWDENIAPDTQGYELLCDLSERIGYAAHFEPAEGLPNERGMVPKAA